MRHVPVLIFSLNVYNTALEVRKAREQGRVEGREEVGHDSRVKPRADRSRHGQRLVDGWATLHQSLLILCNRCQGLYYIRLPGLATRSQTYRFKVKVVRLQATLSRGKLLELALCQVGTCLRPSSPNTLA